MSFLSRIIGKTITIREQGDSLEVDPEVLKALRDCYDGKAVPYLPGRYYVRYPTHVEFQAAGRDQLEAWHKGLPQPLSPDERRIMAAIQKKLAIPTPEDEPGDDEVLMEYPDINPDQYTPEV